MPRAARILFFSLLLATAATAQPYTLLIKNGLLIDPAANRYDTLDIAILDNHIIKIAKDIDPRSAKNLLDARGMIVCPGLIDIHTHVFFAPHSTNGQSTSRQPATNAGLEYAGGPEALHPDSFSFQSGVTTIVDAGSSGWRNFPIFKSR